MQKERDKLCDCEGYCDCEPVEPEVAVKEPDPPAKEAPEFGGCGCGCGCN